MLMINSKVRGKRDYNRGSEAALNSHGITENKQNNTTLD